MPTALPIGRALRRFRRLNGIKQGHAAELLNVSQGSVSRWESEAITPAPCHHERIAAMISAHANSGSDAALRRLILTSTATVHLICDATHKLLAVSPPRAHAWRTDVAAFIGTSLWRFASPEIIDAEAALLETGWHDAPFQSHSFTTGPNGSDVIVIRPGRMRWESIPLADGRVGRLTTAIG
ncbi:transcriptional regulator with XRE-family HTH domain [Sphingomonas sp. UYAg733]